jgi:hypothetical protein
LSNFFAYVATQFSCTVKAIQCDNGREFDNSSTRTFLPSKGAQLRMSCPYTSPQNGKAERIIRTINNVIRTLLIQASLPKCYWAEGLHTAVYLLNRLPTKTISAACPHVALFGSAPSYEHLRVFSCACYPNIATTAPHKLAPRSTRCVFLGYSTDHKGYRCPDLSTNRLIVSRHVVFDEDSFPLAASPNLNDLDFLLESGSTVSTIGTCPPPCRFYHHGGLPVRPGGSPGLRAPCGSSAHTGSPSGISASCGLDDARCASRGPVIPRCARRNHTDTYRATRCSRVSHCATHGFCTSCGHGWSTTS